jgi:hypothetical protein
MRGGSVTLQAFIASPLFAGKLSGSAAALTTKKDSNSGGAPAVAVRLGGGGGGGGGGGLELIAHTAQCKSWCSAIDSHKRTVGQFKKKTSNTEDILKKNGCVWPCRARERAFCTVL